MIRVIELFSGIGAQHQALKNAGIPHKIIAVSEIDKHAIAGYNAIHGNTPNLGDIRNIEHLPECDLITYSFPCQDLSVAGNRAGMVEGSGTRSALLWEVGRLLEDMHKRGVLPDTLLMENVYAILNKNNIDQFRKWILKLEAMGYESSYAVLNAKDYGIPQNRKRCFMVSTLNAGKLVFPPGFPLKLRLKDMLEEEVPESYYLSKERIAKFEKHRIRNESKGNNFGWKPIDPETENITNTITDNPDRHASGNWIKEVHKNDVGGMIDLKLAGNLNDKTRIEQQNRVYSIDGLSPTICGCSGGGTMPQIEEKPAIIKAGEIKNDSSFIGGKTVYDANGVAPTLTTTHPGIGLPKIQETFIKYPTANSTGFIPAYDGDGVVTERLQTARGTVQPQKSPTICTQKGGVCGVVTDNVGDLRIRYLTPRECLRLMGFDDPPIDRLMAAVPSKTHQYKLAGNSIVVNCLESIFKAIYIDKKFT